MTASLLACPVCLDPLERDDKVYFCPNGHSYDRGKSGYVNLLLPNRKQSAEPGDSKEMIDARRSFLRQGHYSRLADSLQEITTEHFDKKKSHPKTLLDAGCGEGYYSGYISEKINRGFGVSFCGIDISKSGIMLASKSYGSIEYAVAGIHNLPLTGSSVGVILNVFAPRSWDEFSRVLSDNGLIISVTPGPGHLISMREKLYDNVKMPEDEISIPGVFEVTETVNLKYNIQVHGGESISSLVRMTPFYHKIPKWRIDSFIENTPELETPVHFSIRLIRRAE